MARFLVIHAVMFIMAIVRKVPAEGSTIDELMQRIVQVEATQMVQQEIIKSQQETIAYLKGRCFVGDKWLTEGNVDERVKAPELPPSLNVDQHKRQSNGNGVAFSAFLDHDDDLGMFEKLIFNQVILNEGGAYDTTTGVFTCPVAGVYLFSFFLGEKDQHQASLQFVVNNQHTSDAIVETSGFSQDAQGGNMVMKRLVRGDNVWLKLIVGSHVEGSSKMRITTFSGALLYQ